jgi:hypothetical protein
MITVCTKTHTEHIQTPGGQNVEFFLLLNLVVYPAAAGLSRVKIWDYPAVCNV